MQMFIFLVLAYSVFVLLIVGLGAGAGFILNWSLPWLDKSLSVVIGVIATGFALSYIVQLIAAVGAPDDGETAWRLDGKQGTILRAIPSTRRKKRRPE